MVFGVGEQQLEEGFEREQLRRAAGTSSSYGSSAIESRSLR
jgi:hypothetical protein